MLKNESNQLKTRDHQVFDHFEFEGAFCSDLRKAKGLVLIQSPFLAARKIERLRIPISSCIERGVRICVFVQDPDAGKKGSRSDSTNRETIISAGKTLASFGVHVTLRPRIHEKLIVIDESIFWDGSLNVLSHNDSTERMTRWNCREKVVEAINRHKLYACLTCLSRTQFQLLPNKENNCDFKIIGRFLKKRREFLGLSQGELAMKSGLSQNLISCIENASRDVKVSTLSRVCGELGVRLRGLPWFMMPGLDEHFLDD